MSLSDNVIAQLQDSKELAAFVKLSEESDVKAFLKKTNEELEEAVSASAVEIARITRSQKNTSEYQKVMETKKLLDSGIREATKIDKARLNLGALALILQQEELRGGSVKLDDVANSMINLGRIGGDAQVTMSIDGGKEVNLTKAAQTLDARSNG